MRKWTEISSLSNNFLFLRCNYITTTLKYVTFCRKNLCIRTMSPNVWLFCAVCQNRILLEPAKVGMFDLSQRHHKSCCASYRRRIKSMNAAAGLPVLCQLPRGTVKIRGNGLPVLYRLTCGTVKRQLRRKVDHAKREKLTNVQIKTQLQHGKWRRQEASVSLKD